MGSEMCIRDRNNLIPDTWIDIFFLGDVPTVITGKITNLDTRTSLIASYHCSKLNFNTHKVNLVMLEKIFYKAKEVACCE